MRVRCVFDESIDLGSHEHMRRLQVAVPVGALLVADLLQNLRVRLTASARPAWALAIDGFGLHPSQQLHGLIRDGDVLYVRQGHWKDSAENRGDAAIARDVRSARDPAPAPAPKRLRVRHQAESSEDVTRLVKISKALTMVLRHTATSLSLSIGSDGYIALDDVLDCSVLRKFQCTREEVETVVRQSDKQRFTLAEVEGVWCIRANQGHSMKIVKDELLLERLSPSTIDLPSVVVHGTYMRHLESILRRGLLAGSRNHVHFATGLPGEGGAVSGMRGNCEIAIFLDVAHALASSLVLYRSANGVILSPGLDGAIPTNLFERVVRLKDGVILWPRTNSGS
mmetsp:Transcript_18383/g.50452  ORF Transcript_18383/g.50452 Transcript_18383/m.50452 type:complete len:339 (+) Transcript_18383:71-1087(+)